MSNYKMQDKYSIISDIYKDALLTKVELDFVVTQFEQIYFDKGGVIFRTGDIVYYQYYVLDGCLRSYLIDDGGKEHTCQFAVRDWWISDFRAFFTTSSASTSLECIERATVLRVSRESMLQLYEKVPKISAFNRIKLENAYASLQRRILKTSSESAKDRYISFINTYPNIEQVVKNYHIASYIGIARESLSRIRKEIANQHLN